MSEAEEVERVGYVLPEAFVKTARYQHFGLKGAPSGQPEQGDRHRDVWLAGWWEERHGYWEFTSDRVSSAV